MRKKEVLKVFKQLGWSVRGNDGFMLLEDRVLRISARDQGLTGYIQFLMSSKFSTDLFCGFASEIAGEKKRFWSMTKLGAGRYRCSRQELTYRDFKFASDQAIEWAYAQDLDGVLSDMRKELSKPLEWGPITHLAALALNGDIDALRRYQLNFDDADEELGFVPYVTKEAIDRAAALAEIQASRCASGQAI